MTKEELEAQFSMAASKAKNETDIRDAIATLPGNPNQIASFIITFCKIKGINPHCEALYDYYQQTEEYRAAIEAQNNQKALDCIISDIETITKDYRENESRGVTPSQKQIDEITELINKQTANLGAAQGKCRIYTTADYIDDCLKYDPSKDFCPGLFGGLAFPNGTVSYIGARTSRGKTTAMVNLTREALIKQKRKTIFITLEMSGKQIFNKIILSTAFSIGIETASESRQDFLSMESHRDIYTVWKNGDLLGSGANIFRRYVEEANTVISQADTSGAFILYDGRGASEPEIINFIHAHAEPGVVILLDYIQKMPPKPGTDTDSFRRVQAISYDVVNAAAKTNAVIIAGAQFNRIGGADNLGDIFNDQSFREAGDIEQDAHNAIGIGWTTDKQGRFYEVLKTREDKKQGLLYELDFEGSYSYMTHKKQIFRPINEKPQSKGNNKGTEKTPLINEGPF